MSQNDIVAPVATVDTSQCTIAPPWFVQDTEYPPALATYRPLVNGEEAFAAVYHAIENAQKTVDIICWGFQPSMYFIRDGRSLCIGELLCKIAKEKKVQVRILGWEMPFNTAGFADEANLPGKGAIRLWDRAGQSASEEQYSFDKWWFGKYSYTGELADVVSGMDLITGQAAQADMRNAKLHSLSPLFVSRGFDASERAEIAYRLAYQAQDPDISAATVGTMAASVTHHQKTVLIDYELPEHAVGFVMGHNMLDEYWDTDAHSSQNRTGSAKPVPNKGPRGFLPRQDISSRVTGPILEHLHHNFATAWQKETRQDLLKLRNAKTVAKNLKPRAGYGTPVMAQLLRTQAQEGRRDIEKLYLKTVNNATQFIYIENQYFRWPPLAEAITTLADAQTKGGRDPAYHGPLHLFVITNVTDQGIGAGTVNTQRMLEVLGQANTIPEVTRLRRINKLQDDMQRDINSALTDDPFVYVDPRDPAAKAQTEEKRKQAEVLKRRVEEYGDKIQETKKTVFEVEERSGLKVHICSLVAKDSPPDNWMPVYIHSKLMIINDVFTTHGSANINTRSMQVDSEMNIAHECASVTKTLRQRLWNLHTSGKGGQDDSAKAFEAWGNLLSQNHINQYGEEKKAPEAPLVKFLYDKATLKDMD